MSQRGGTSYEQLGDDVSWIFAKAGQLLGLVLFVFMWVTVFVVQDETYGGPPEWGTPHLGRLAWAVGLTWLWLGVFPPLFFTRFRRFMSRRPA